MKKLAFFLLLTLMAACTRSLSTPNPRPTAAAAATPAVSPVPIYTLPPTRGPGTPIAMPTPDAPHPVPTPRGEIWHLVQYGDTLGQLAQQYGLSLEALMAANGLTDPNQLAVGQTLRIPQPQPQGQAPGLKLIPDSELVDGPYSRVFDLEAFVREQNGYLAQYREQVGGEDLSGSQIVARVAADYSVNPRLLLALLEHRSGWVTGVPADPDPLRPLGLEDGWRTGLYRQRAWAADELNRGFYGWQENRYALWVLADGRAVRVNPQVNAGTAALQHLFARLDGYADWQRDLSLEGFLATYMRLFGYPFDYAIEPLLPADLTQPPLALPFAAGETWYFTGGPHGGWDEGSAWAALDFAPPDAEGCLPSAYLVRASAEGVIVRSDHGAVVQDLDGDGHPQTGWTLLYMHIAPEGRAPVGAYLHVGDPIGSPSCEGGLANGAHVHLARRYNGVWIAADGPLSFVLDGWQARSSGRAYDGYLLRGSEQVEAFDARREENRLSR